MTQVSKIGTAFVLLLLLLVETLFIYVLCWLMSLHLHY